MMDAALVMLVGYLLVGIALAVKAHKVLSRDELFEDDFTVEDAVALTANVVLFWLPAYVIVVIVRVRHWWRMWTQRRPSGPQGG
jgi:hypothetical protein